jgi:DNA-binding IclR family transcriptional regulator
MAGLDRYTAVLRLFTEAHSEWTVPDMAEALGVPQSTVYRTVHDLVAENFLETASDARYRLGSVFIEFGRLLRLTDPLLKAGSQVLRDVVGQMDVPCVGLLCRLYNDKVMCIADEISPRATFRSSYERGKPMPLTQGATSKVILAHLPARRFNRLAEHWPDANASAFRSELQSVRRRGVCISSGEIDKDVVGIAAPILRKGTGVLASISLVLPVASTTPAFIDRVAQMTMEGARHIEQVLEDAAQPN